jgi:hypothetical protein
MAEAEEFTGPLDDIAGKREIEVECTTPEYEPELCDGWSETVELDKPAYLAVDGNREKIFLPGFSWECPECGNPHDFVIEGVEVTTLV